VPLFFSELSRIKDALRMARADTLHNANLKFLLDYNSTMVEQLTGRPFEKVERTEYHKSYDQGITEPDPLYIFPKSVPVDSAQTLTLIYAQGGLYDTAGVTLVINTDFTLGENNEYLAVRAATGLVNTSIAATVAPVFAYAERGFRLLYTGGYVKSAAPGSDPLDEGNVVAVPDALKMIVAAKVARDFEAGGPKEWTEGEKASLIPWTRQSGFWGG
jgi:hypothetical protein